MNKISAVVVHAERFVASHGDDFRATENVAGSLRSIAGKEVWK